MTSYIQVEIPKRARVCCLKQEPFKPGDTYHSRLSVDYIREDFCEECWKNKPLHMTLTSWKGKVPAKTKLEEKTDRLEKALILLREGDDPVERMIIALYLQRKKWIHLHDEFKKGDKTFLLYEVVQTEEMIEIEKKVLSPQDAEKQAIIASKLRS